MRQKDKDELVLLLAVAYFKQNGDKIEEYIEEYDKESFLKIVNQMIYFNDKKEFNDGLKDMLTETYKKVIKKYRNKIS